MSKIEFEDGAIQVDARVVAKGLGIEPPQVMAGLRDGEIQTLSEKGVDEDAGRYRLTFFSRTRRFRLIVDENGTILKRLSAAFARRSE